MSAKYKKHCHAPENSVTHQKKESIFWERSVLDDLATQAAQHDACKWLTHTTETRFE
jgi:hypothetical protein